MRGRLSSLADKWKAAESKGDGAGGEEGEEITEEIDQAAKRTKCEGITSITLRVLLPSRGAAREDWHVLRSEMRTELRSGSAGGSGKGDDGRPPW